MHFFCVDLVAGFFSSLVRREADLVILVEGRGGKRLNYGGCAPFVFVFILHNLERRALCKEIFIKVNNAK